LHRASAKSLGLSIALVFLAALVLAPGAAAKPWIGVEGKHLVDARGEPVRLIGVNRSGPEFRCQQQASIFDGPTSWRSIEKMKSWHINVVRVPLNETCWLGINGIPPEFGGAMYRTAIHWWVSRLERAGLYVILDLHRVAPGEQQAYGIPMMADADHAPDFWRSVAAEFRDDRSVLFDLYNEPHDVDWECWRSGCTVDDPQLGVYRTAGMQELLDAVRSTGARQPVMVGGVDWAGNLEQWLGYRPVDPARALVASNHTYDWGPCWKICREAIAEVASRVPVVTGEMGQSGCAHDYIDGYMRWADRHDISYLGWTWNAKSFWNCTSGPSLIADYSGRPTHFGIGFREHLRELAEAQEAAKPVRARRTRHRR